MDSELAIAAGRRLRLRHAAGALALVLALAAARAEELPGPNPPGNPAVTAPVDFAAARAVSRELALAGVAVGAVLLLFGKRLYRVAVVFAGAVLGGHAARFFALLFDYGASASMFTLVGAAAGGILALVLEMMLRLIVGALAGMVVLATLAAAFTSSATAVVLSAFAGLVIGAGLSYVYKRAILITGFSLIGAGMLTFGVASLRAATGEPVVLSGVAVLGMILAAAAGVVFQYAMESRGAAAGQEEAGHEQRRH